ncbi:unnamed protein product [Brassica rapa]|uniref:Uncharacterized protein n=2 Tax=Brassica TaxID=3705 RepID=A0A8D9GDC1_BRACM|nr:unnamed protein product [Brassica napus]CAG7878280.1 unnamed protein product [Brassica rapa]
MLEPCSQFGMVFRSGSLLVVQGVWGLRLCSLVAFRRNRSLLDSFASDKVDLGWGGNGSVDGFSSGSEFQGKWLVSAVDSDLVWAPGSAWWRKLAVVCWCLSISPDGCGVGVLYLVVEAREALSRCTRRACGGAL